MTAFPAGKPEIKVNPAYFEKIGRPVPVPDVPETKAAPELDIKVNLDAEYFRWRQKKKSRWLKNVPIRYGKKLSISDGHNHLGNTYPIIFIFEFPQKHLQNILRNNSV